MVNAKTRNQWKAHLESTEALPSSVRDGKGEAEVQQAQVPSVAVSKRKKSWSKKRKLGEVLEEQESAALGGVEIQNGVEDDTRGKSSSVHDGSSGAELRADSGKAAMGSSDPRAPAHQRARKRGIDGAMERTRDKEVERPAESNISHDIPRKEAEVYYEEKKGKRKVLGDKARKHGKEKVGDVVSYHSRELNPKRKRRNLLAGLDAVSEDIVNLAGPLTRGMVKPGTDGQTGAAYVEKRKQFKPEEMAEAQIVTEGKSAGAEVPIAPGEEAAKMPNVDLLINDSNVEYSNKTAEFDRVLDTKAIASLETPAGVSGLNHVPSQEEAKLSKTGRTRNNGKKAIASLETPAGVSGLNHVPSQEEAKLSKTGRTRNRGKSISEIHMVKDSQDRLPKPISPPVTRGMIDRDSDPAGNTKGPSPLTEDPNSGSSLDEPVDQAAVLMTAIETASMQLRNHKNVGENLNSAERPRKRAKKKQDKPPTGTSQKQVDMMNASYSMLKSRPANGMKELDVVDAATTESQVNHAEPERNGNSSLNREVDNGGGEQLSTTEGAHTRGSKMDGPSGIEPQVESGLLSSVSGLSVQPIKDGIEKKNDKDTSLTKQCTEGDGRKGGRLGRMKKRGKKKIDPGGSDFVQDKKASDSDRTVPQLEETHQCKLTDESPHLGPGPSNEAQAELGKQRIDVQNVEGMTSEAAGKSQKPAELSQMRDKTGVEKSVQLAETDGGCQQIDRHHLAPKNLQDENSNGDGKLETVMPREGPSKPVGVRTRGSMVDGRKSTGPANGSTKKNVKTGGRLGRWIKSRKKADSRGLLQNPKSHIEDRDVGSARVKAVDGNALQDEQTHQCTQGEESSQLGLGTSSEDEMGLGEEGVDAQGIEADTLKGVGRLNEPSEPHNARFGEKVGGVKQVDHRDQPDEGKDPGVKHSETVIPRKLPVRTMGVLTRGRKVDVQSRTEPEMESGLQPRKRGKKRKSSVEKHKGSAGSAGVYIEKAETRAHFERSKEGGTMVVDSRGLSASSDCQAQKGGLESILDKKTGQVENSDCQAQKGGEDAILQKKTGGESLEAAGNTENQTELEDEGFEEEKGTELPVQLAGKEDGCKKNNHHDQAPEMPSVETHNVGEENNFVKVSEKNSTKRRRRKGSRRVREEDVPTKDSSLLNSSMALTNVEMGKVSEDAGKSVEMADKRERKKQEIRTDGDLDRPEIANVETPASVGVTFQSLEPANKSSADGKGRRKKVVTKGIAPDSQPSLENTDLVLPIEDGDVPESYHVGSCNGDHNGQEELSKGSLVPKRRKTGRSRIVTPTSMVTEGTSKVVPEVGYSIKVTELSSGQGVDSGVVQSEGAVGQGGLLDDVVKVTPKASHVGLPAGDGIGPDQGEPCSCDHEAQQKLPIGLSVPKGCNTIRSQIGSCTTKTVDCSTSMEITEEVNLKDFPYEHGVTEDIVQTERLEGRAEPLHVAVEVTQNPSQVGAELALQSSEAEGGPDSVQVPARKKKLWRRRDYGCGIEFQRITRARDSKGKSLTDIESQGGKNGTVADAVVGEHVEIRAEGVVSTTDKSTDFPRLEETDTQKEDLELGKRLPDVSNLADKCVSTSPKDDIAGMTNEQEKDVKVIETQKPRVPESPRTDVCAVQDAEKSEEPTSNPSSVSSVLNHSEESETPVQGELNGEQDDQLASSIVSLLSNQQKNIKVPDVLSKLPYSPDGPFALEDGRSLTLHCGQEKASGLDAGGLIPEVSHSPYFEKICAQDSNHFVTAHGAYSSSTLDKSESLTMVKISDPDAIVDKSDPVVTMVESDLVDTMVESYPVAPAVESDCVVTAVESDPVATIVESNPIATMVESDPVATTAVSDPVTSAVESDSVASMVDSDSVAAVVDSDPAATIVESGPLDAAERLNSITTSDNSSVDMPNAITTENMLEAIPAIGKPEFVAAVTDSDSVSPSVTSEVKAVSIATLENSSVPTNVVIKENTTEQLQLKCMACEIGLVRKFAVSSTDDEKISGECLITEAVNSRQEQVAVEAPLEDFGLRDDNSTESPLLECEGFEQNLEGKVADSVGQRQPAPEEDSVGQPTSDVEDSLPDGSAFPEPWTKENGSMTEPDPITSPKGGAYAELVSLDATQLEFTDQKCTKESSDVVELEQCAADRTPLEGSRVASLDYSLLIQKAEPGVDVSSNDTQKCFAPGDLPVGTEQVMTSRSAKSIAADRIEGRSSLDDVTVGNEPLEEKLPSGVEDLHQTQSEGQEPDDSIRKNVDIELEDRIEVHDETKKENAEVQEVQIEADGIHTEAKHVHSKTGEILAHEIRVHAEAKEVNLNAEEVNLVVGTVQVELQEVQAEIQEVQVEAQMVDGAVELHHISLNGDAESLNADIEGKQLDTEAKETHVGANDVHSELEGRTEVNEANALQEMDAQAKDALVEEVTDKNEHAKERLLGLENLDATSTWQSPASNFVPSCDSSVCVGGKAMSVPEVDVSRPLSSDSILDQQTGPVRELMITEPVTLGTEKDVQLDKQELCIQLNRQDTVQSGQLTSPVKAGGCLEADVLQLEELSDIQMETHEKDDPKTQPLNLENRVSQRNMAGVRGSLVFKKRKGRTGIEATKELEGGGRAEDAPSRVYPKKKGFLLASTSIESGGMRIRPRPLDPDQCIPILVEGRDKDFYEYDGGSFYRWVQQQQEAKLKNLAVDPVADGVIEGGGSSTVSRTHLVKKHPIFIPLFRKLPDDQQANCRIVTRSEQDVLPGIQSPFPIPQVYLRHTQSAPRKLGHALGGSFSTVPSVYDMDDEDGEWLHGYNETLKLSGPDHLLSDDTFEQLMELFEREFYRIGQINNKSLPILPKNLGEKGGASGRRRKRLVMDSSQRHTRLEASKDGARFSESVEFLKAALSQKEVERRFSPQNGPEDCCICNGGENSDSNPVRRCQICSINVHESCYGICGTEGNEFGHHAESPSWCCRKCEAVVGGRALPSISCAICCKSGGAMKPTVDPLKWAHVACALYTNETFFIDTEAMEPVDGLAAVETRVKKQRERCGLCGAREGSCVRCSTRGCRAPFHISCGVSQGASFELRHAKQQVLGVRSFCPRHATLVPGTNIDEFHCAPSMAEDAGEPLPAVSTESSDTLEMRNVERRNMGEKGNGTEDAIMSGAGWQVSFSNKPKLHRSESKRYSRKKRSGARPKGVSAGGATPSELDPSSSPHEVSDKDVHGVSRTLPRSGSMLKENMQGVSQYMDETDPYVHPSDAERLESEAVSAATSVSSSHLTLTFENVDRTGKATSNADEVDPVVVVTKDKSMTGDADNSDAVSLTLPSLETLDTNLAPPQIVKAVYSFWQAKRVKSKGPILHELRQLQAARSQGIFNKIVQQSTDLLPQVVHDSLSRMPITRRPRSLNRDPVFSKFSELRQQLEMLRSIASNVVRREQLKLDDQKLVYESVQQQFLIAREAPKSRQCLWCENTQSLLSCSSCPKAFCFQCFKHTKGYGVKGWIAASKLSKYVCNFCVGSTAQERGWPEFSTTFAEPRGNPVSRVALVPGRLGDWNHGLEVRTKPNSGKQVSFLSETHSIPYGSSSSPQKAPSKMAPGRGKTIHTGPSTDGHAVHSDVAVPNTDERNRAVNRAYHGVLSSGPNDPAGNENRAQSDRQHGEGKKVKRRRVKTMKNQVEPKTVLRATKRIKKLARSSSFVYGSEDETVSESEESRPDKKTVKLSDLRDKGEKSQCTNLLEVGAENNAEKRLPPLKFGIKFSSSGKLILTRRVPPSI